MRTPPPAGRPSPCHVITPSTLVLTVIPPTSSALARRLTCFSNVSLQGAFWGWRDFVAGIFNTR